jgi:hypothetical protein
VACAAASGRSPSSAASSSASSAAARSGADQSSRGRSAAGSRDAGAAHPPAGQPGRPCAGFSAAGTHFPQPGHIFRSRDTFSCTVFVAPADGAAPHKRPAQRTGHPNPDQAGPLTSWTAHKFDGAARHAEELAWQRNTRTAGLLRANSAGMPELALRWDSGHSGSLLKSYRRQPRIFQGNIG